MLGSYDAFDIDMDYELETMQYAEIDSLSCLKINSICDATTSEELFKWIDQLLESCHDQFDCPSVTSIRLC